MRFTELEAKLCTMENAPLAVVASLAPVFGVDKPNVIPRYQLMPINSK